VGDFRSSEPKINLKLNYSVEVLEQARGHQVIAPTVRRDPLPPGTAKTRSGRL